MPSSTFATRQHQLLNLPSFVRHNWFGSSSAGRRPATTDRAGDPTLGRCSRGCWRICDQRSHPARAGPGVAAVGGAVRNLRGRCRLARRPMVWEVEELGRPGVSTTARRYGNSASWTPPIRRRGGSGVALQPHLWRVAGIPHVDGVDEPHDAARVREPSRAMGARPAAKEADAAQRVAIGDAGRAEDDCLPEARSAVMYTRSVSSGRPPSRGRAPSPRR